MITPGIDRKVFAQLQAGNEFTIEFVSEFSMFNGTYKVLETKKGPGAGGSNILKVLNTETGIELKEMGIAGQKAYGFGSPMSKFVTKLTFGNEVFVAPELAPKTNNANQRGKLNPQQVQAAVALKEVILACKPGMKIKVKSTDSSLDGTWNVMSTKKLKGPGYQVALVLSNETKKPIELCSYRHALMINSIEEVEEQEVPPSTEQLLEEMVEAVENPAS